MGVQALDNVAYWQARANEARAVAAYVQDPNARAMMLTIAAKHEAQAKRLQTSEPKIGDLKAGDLKRRGRSGVSGSESSSELDTRPSA